MKEEILKNKERCKERDLKIQKKRKIDERKRE
jgi:hypothetical protein